VNPPRALAYDPLQDHFWVANYVTSIFEVSRSGDVVQEVSHSLFGSLVVTGLAWNPTDADGCNLYVFGRRIEDTGALVSKMNPETHAVQPVVALSGPPEDRAAGCAITTEWNSYWLAFGGIVGNAQRAELSIRRVAWNGNWISVTPAELTVAAHGSEDVTISLNPVALRPWTYYVNAGVRSVIQDTTRVLTLAVQVLDLPAEDPRPSPMPEKFALYQNYPNPFNPVTEIRYDLPRSGPVSLRVFDLLGREVAVLKDGVAEAGTHRVTFDGSKFSTGIYFARLSAGSLTQTKKLMLLK
jgi:hypothetical protein